MRRYISTWLIVYRLADKALDVFHHLSRRGSVWAEASATAVRELRDRITRRPTRYHEVNSTSSEVDGRTGRVTEPNISAPHHYTSSSGITPQPSEIPGDPGRTTSSTGLPHDSIESFVTQSVVSGPSGASNRPSQATHPASLLESARPLNAVPALPYQNTNTPVFDFGNSEWNEFLHASETLDPSIPLSQGDGMDPYIGFDIPFWLGQDQYQDMLHDRS